MIWLDWVLQALGTTGSIAGIILNSRKKISCWIIWSVANVFWIWLNIRFELWLAVATMVVYTALNAVGYFKWRKDAKC